MNQRSIGIAAAVLFLGLVAIAYGWQMRAASPVAASPAPAVAGTAATPANRALELAEAERVLLPRVEAEGAAAPEAPPPLHGRVVDLRTGIGLARHTVRLAVPREGLAATDGVDGDDAQVELTTDTAGGFALQLSRCLLPNVVAGAVVLDEYPSPVFSGHVLLTDGMTILVEPAQVLRGRIVDAAASCEQAPGYALLQERPGPGGPAQMLGKGTLDAQGAFEVRARVPWPDLPVQVKVGCSDHLFVLTTDAATLTSPQGFTGELGLGRTVVRVQDERGAPLADARMMASPRHAAVQGTFVRRATSADGLATLPVPRCGLELAVTAPGRRTAVEFVAGDPAPAEVVVRLEALDAYDWIRGTVRTASGEPVAKAVVTAMADATAAAVRVLDPIQGRTDADGRFELRAGADGTPFAVTAFDKRHGMSREVKAQPGGPELELVVPGVHPLRIHAVAPGADTRSRGGDVDWYLLPADGDRGGNGLCGSGALPIETEPVGAGDYDLLLLWADMDLFARARVQVDPVVRGEPTELVVFFEPAAWFEGTVEGAGPGWTVRCPNQAWIRDVNAAWCAAPLGSTGRFRLLAGGRERGRVEVVDDRGEVRAAADVAWGAPQAIRVETGR